MVLGLVSLNHALLEIGGRVWILHHGWNRKVRSRIPIKRRGCETVWNGERLARSKGRPRPGVDSRTVSVARGMDDAFEQLGRKAHAAASQGQDCLSQEKQGSLMVGMGIPTVGRIDLIGFEVPEHRL